MSCLVDWLPPSVQIREKRRKKSKIFRSYSAFLFFSSASSLCIPFFLILVLFPLWLRALTVRIWWSDVSRGPRWLVRIWGTSMVPALNLKKLDLTSCRKYPSIRFRSLANQKHSDISLLCRKWKSKRGHTKASASTCGTTSFCLSFLYM